MLMAILVIKALVLLLFLGKPHKARTFLPRMPLLTSSSSTTTTVFTLQNNCPYTVWPATLSTNSFPTLGGSGCFELPPNGTTSIPAPPGWSGRFWARTGCHFTPSRATCATGDAPPVTLAEFTLGDDKDSYDVSLVDGYNVGIGVNASNGECKYAGCVADVNERCPAELRVEGADGETVGCRSACKAFGGEEYCCTGKHSTPETCGPTRYSQLFKAACPNAYSYVYDDETNTCAAGSDYLITFCPYSGAGGRRR